MLRNGMHCSSPSRKASIPAWGGLVVAIAMLAAAVFLSRSAAEATPNTSDSGATGAALAPSSCDEFHIATEPTVAPVTPAQSPTGENQLVSPGPGFDGGLPATPVELAGGWITFHQEDPKKVPSFHISAVSGQNYGAADGILFELHGVSPSVLPSSKSLRLVSTDGADIADATLTIENGPTSFG